MYFERISSTGLLNFISNIEKVYFNAIKPELKPNIFRSMSKVVSTLTPHSRSINLRRTHFKIYHSLLYEKKKNKNGKNLKTIVFIVKMIHKSKIHDPVWEVHGRAWRSWIEEIWLFKIQNSIKNKMTIPYSILKFFL